MKRTSNAFINVRMFFQNGAGIAKLNGSFRTIVDKFGVLVPGNVQQIGVKNTLESTIQRVPRQPLVVAWGPHLIFT